MALKGNLFSLPLARTQAGPLDTSSVINTGFESLTLAETWKTGNGDQYTYVGQTVTVLGSADPKNDGIYILKSADYTNTASWEKVSQTDATIAALSSAIEDLEGAASDDFSSINTKIETISSNVEIVSGDLAGVSTKLDTVSGDLDAAELAIDTKLDKNFKSYDAGDINSTVVFPANTEAGANVYITSEQIKDFAASAVSDKGNFVDEAAIKAAYPTPDEGWYATNLETGTTWIVVDGQWIDSESTNGVVSVNGKSGKVTLVAADIDDVYSKTEVESAITSAITTAQTDITSAIDAVEAKVDTNITNITALSGAIDGNSELIEGLRTDVDAVSGKADTNAANIATNLQSINSINGQITSINSALASKQDAAIDVTIGGEAKTSIPDALTALNAIATSTQSGLESKANVDASNIESSVWKTKLGYQDATDVSTAISSAIEPVSTKLDTVSSDLDTAESKIEELATTVNDYINQIVDVQDGITDLYTKTDTLSTTIDTKAAIDASNITPATWRTKLEVSSSTEIATTYQPQNLANKVFDDVATVEGTLSRLNTKVEANAGEITNIKSVVGDSTSGLVKSVSENTSAIALKANTDDVVLNSEIDIAIPETASDERVPSTKLVKEQLAGKQNSLTHYSETEYTANIQTEGRNGIITLSTNSVSIAVNANTGIILNGDLSGTAIDTELTSSTTKVPTSKAVKDAIDTIKSEISTAYQFKGSDTYANIVAKTGMEVGDVWNSTTANGTYPAGTNYAWTGEEWDALGGEVDLSAYQTKEITVAGLSSTTVASALEELESKKQNDLVGYSESGINEYYVDNASINATTISLNGSEGGYITVNDSSIEIDASSGMLILNGPVTGTAITSSITASETTIPTSKAVKDAIDTKADANASNLTAENVVSWKTKLGFISAEDQVQPDWNATEGKAQILNAPKIKAVGDTTQFNDGLIIDTDSISYKYAVKDQYIDLYNSDTTTLIVGLATSCRLLVSIGGAYVKYDISVDVDGSAVITKDILTKDISASTVVITRIDSSSISIQLTGNGGPGWAKIITGRGV